IWAVSAVACAMLGVTCGVMALIVALWNSHRMLGLIGGMIVFIALAAFFGYQGARALRVHPDVLEGSLEQLAEDERRARGGGGSGSASLKRAAVSCSRSATLSGPSSACGSRSWVRGAGRRPSPAALPPARSERLGRSDAIRSPGSWPSRLCCCCGDHAK